MIELIRGLLFAASTTEKHMPREFNPETIRELEEIQKQLDKEQEEKEREGESSPTMTQDYVDSLCMQIKAAMRLKYS